MSIRHLARTTGALLAGVLCVIAAAAPFAAAAPGTLRAVELSTPGLGEHIAIAAPGGGTFSANPGRATLRLTPSGGVATQSIGWCVDPTRAIEAGVDYPVDLQSSTETPALLTPAFREAGWLISAADGLIASAPAAGFEAAAIQVTVWQILGLTADVPAVTASAALNARVAELRALADGKSVVTTIALAGPAAAVTAGSPTTVTLTGTPGAVVELSVAAGAATLAASSVTLGPSGAAQVAVTPAAAGSVVVRASAQGGSLTRAAHPSGQNQPQDMAYVTPAVLSAEVAMTVVAPSAPVVTPAVTPVPSAPVAGAPAVTVAAKLRIVKSAPSKVRRGRFIHYRIVVKNTGKVAARKVVVRDRLPSGTYLRRVPARARVVKRVVVWRVGTIAPGKRVIMHLWLGTRNARSAVVNGATVSGGNSPIVGARVKTRVLGTRPARVTPAVTG